MVLKSNKKSSKKTFRKASKKASKRGSRKNSKKASKRGSHKNSKKVSKKGSRKVSKKAQMLNSCQLCDLYVGRHDRLLPFKAGELKILENLTNNCKICKNMCDDEYGIFMRNKLYNQAAQQEKKCQRLHRYTSLATLELNRLKQKELLQSLEKEARQGITTNWPKVPTGKLI